MSQRFIFTSLKRGVATTTNMTNRMFIDSVAPKCEKALTLDFSETLSPQELRQSLINLNRDKSPQQLFTKRTWDIDEFAKPNNLPVVVGELKEKALFSARMNGTGYRFLDLPIKFPGTDFRVPDELSQFKEFILLAMQHAKLLTPEFIKYYAFLTVHQTRVARNKSQRRYGFHSDSYITPETRVLGDHSIAKEVKLDTDSVYLAYDCIPTLYLPGPTSLIGVDPGDCTAVLKRFEDFAKERTHVTYPNYNVLWMDPYPLSKHE